MQRHTFFMKTIIKLETVSCDVVSNPRDLPTLIILIFTAVDYFYSAKRKSNSPRIAGNVEVGNPVLIDQLRYTNVMSCTHRLPHSVPPRLQGQRPSPMHSICTHTKEKTNRK